MKLSIVKICAPLLACMLLSGTAVASAYNANPKLVVIIVIDQFRPDFLERARDQLGPSGFRLLTERGAFFTDCYYDYMNTETGPGHATLFTGTYSNAHGIAANQWWDDQHPACQDKSHMVTSVCDDTTQLVGPGVSGPGASPHNLLSDTLGDELKLATDGASRVFSVSFKDRAAVLPGGFAANGAFWIDHKTGAWISSTFYLQQLPAWVQQFNASGKADSYWNREWRDARGAVLRKTTRGTADFYETVGATPFGNDYEFEFARELVEQEKLGEGPATDLLAVSLSPPDILGHKTGPNSPEVKTMVLALDRQLADFFSFLGRRVGLANVWIVISADHGISPVPAYAHSLRLPATALDPTKIKSDLNVAIASRLHHAGNYVEGHDGDYLFLSESAFKAAGMSSEGEAEQLAGQVLASLGVRSYVSRTQLATGALPHDQAGRQWLHSYSSYGGWYIVMVPAPYTFLWDSRTGTTHGSSYRYDQHVPLAFFGLPFQAGVYRGRCEPVDMAATLSSLLGINPPNRAAGRVLTEAVRKENAR
ncbi:MAG: alkaline phosphatase family protein [Terriglobales bacterium]